MYQAFPTPPNRIPEGILNWLKPVQPESTPAEENLEEEAQMSVSAAELSHPRRGFCLYCEGEDDPASHRFELELMLVNDIVEHLENS